MPATAIRMPHAWEPRPHQLPALRALDGGVKRVLLLWHRRAGKDATVLNWCATEMSRRPTSVLYMLPEHKQAKRVLMRELNEQGRTHVEQAFPAPILAGPLNKTEGVVTLWNGSVLQLGGFDRVDSYVGMGPRVVVMSEFAVSRHASRALQLLMPILLRNGGTLILPYTPRGKNHGHRQFTIAQANEDWFCDRLTIEDTGLVPPEAVKAEIEAGTIDEEYARQEFYTSFESPNSGSYYGRAIERLEQLGQVTDVAWEPTMPVYTFWDIGIHDATSIWFAQPHRSGWINIIDYYESDGHGLQHYLDKMNERKALGWRFDPRGQLVPHDFASRDYTSGYSPTQVAQQFGWRMTVVPASEVSVGIDAVRSALPRCRFNAGEPRVLKGLGRLRDYTKRWSAQLQMFTGPQHDEASHGADAFRTGIMGLRLAGFHVATSARVAEIEADEQRGGTAPVVAPTSFNVWGDDGTRSRPDGQGSVGAFEMWGR